MFIRVDLDTPYDSHSVPISNRWNDATTAPYKHCSLDLLTNESRPPGPLVVALLCSRGSTGQKARMLEVRYREYTLAVVPESAGPDLRIFKRVNIDNKRRYTNQVLLFAMIA